MTRLLVTYASTRDSSEEIAQAVALTLHDAGVQVDCRAAATVDRLDDYDAVVLGGCPTARRQAEVRHLLRRHRHALHERPVWQFDDDARRDWPAIAAWAREIAAQLPH